MRADLLPARAHVFDIVPTVLDLAGLPSAPDPNEAVPMRGRSLVPVLTGQANEVYTAEDAVGMEVATNAALYKGDWKLQKMPTVNDMARGIFTIWPATPAKRDLRDAHPEIFEALKKDFAAYEQEVGIIELGADYNPSRIVAPEIGKNLLAFILPYGLGVIFFIAIMAWLGRRLLKTRTTISS